VERDDRPHAAGRERRLRDITAVVVRAIATVPSASAVVVRALVRHDPTDGATGRDRFDDRPSTAGMFEGRPDRDEVVLVGRSNVGKSTLMRELTGHDVTTGRKPGVTREPNHFDWASEGFMFTDLPGFGFMAGVDEDRREAIKTDVVRYVEDNADRILAGVLVVDGKAVVDIIDRHAADGDVPHDVELFAFLRDIDVPAVVAVNKMDKVDDRDERLDALCDRLGLYPPWQQWSDTIAPVSAKRGSIEPLLEILRTRFHEAKRDDLLKFVA
jgi:small GTP-binding protein